MSEFINNEPFVVEGEVLSSTTGPITPGTTGVFLAKPLAVSDVRKKVEAAYASCIEGSAPTVDVYA